MKLEKKPPTILFYGKTSENYGPPGNNQRNACSAAATSPGRFCGAPRLDWSFSRETPRRAARAAGFFFSGRATMRSIILNFPPNKPKPGKCFPPPGLEFFAGPLCLEIFDVLAIITSINRNESILTTSCTTARPHIPISPSAKTPGMRESVRYWLLVNYHLQKPRCPQGLIQ